VDFQSLASELLARSESLCAEWFPAGKRRGHEYVVGDLRGSEGDSLSINLRTGKWSDFATGDAGGDLVSLYAAMEGIEQGEAYKRLTNGHAPACMAKPAKSAKLSKPAPTIVMPVPRDAQPTAMRHPQHGKPSAAWAYRNRAGDLLGYVARYDPAGERKQIVPWVFSEDGWICKQFPEPRPLYGQQHLQPNVPVLVVEGEKAADAAQAIVEHRYAVMTWPGGAQALARADWSLLDGRKVLLWPDADKPGVECMRRVAERLAPVCSEVKLLDVDGMPDGWDAADSGFDWPAFVAWAKPRATVFGSNPTEAAAPVPAVPSPPPSAGIAVWESLGLAVTDKGQVLQNLDNVVRAIEADPTIRGHIWYDEFLDSIVTDWQGPQRKWKDADDVKLALYMQRHVGLTKIGVQTCHDAALVAAFHDTRNECRDFLSGLQWDGVPRVGALMPEGFGADDNPYTEAVGRCWMISMVARVFSPGCKVDTVPVLEGSQGAGKSSGLAILGGKWFVEGHESVMTKDFFGVLQGHMLVEISEMHSFSRAEVERIKGIISCQVDRYRKAYGRNTEDHPRQTVLVCTTNRDDWQKDDTGARRFWPVRCGKVDHDWLRRNREQLFAEAVRLYLDGVSWWDVPNDRQQEEVEARRDVDAWEPVIQQWLEGKYRVHMTDLLDQCLKIEIGRQDQMVQKRVARILRVLNWKRGAVRDGGAVYKGWVRVTQVTM
jgi:predicted P-loop ATPase